jgi:hypothetical protein
MSRSGDEMVLELAKILNAGMDKTAAKKDKKEEEKEPKGKKPDDEEVDEEDTSDEEEGKEDKPKKDKKKAKAMLGVVNDLVKLANDLDSAGANEASSLVDEALQIILKELD